MPQHRRNLVLPVLTLTLVLLVFFTGCPAPLGYFPNPSDAYALAETIETAPPEAVETPYLYERALGSSGDYTVVTADAASFDTNRELIFRSTTPGATIYYTTDGSFPDLSSKPFDPDQPLIVNQDSTSFLYTAIAIKSLMLPSEVHTQQVALDYQTVSTPAFTDSNGNPVTNNEVFNDSATITITSATTGPNPTVIYYELATGGPASSPDPNSSPVYSGPITVTDFGTTEIKAIAKQAGMADSIVSTVSFRVAPSISTISVVGMSPQLVLLPDGTTVTVTLDYVIAEADGLDISIVPLTSGSQTPGSTSSAPASRSFESAGTLTQTFSVSGSAVTVDQIEVLGINSATGGPPVVDFTVPVVYAYNQNFAAGSISLSGAITESMDAADLDGDGADELAIMMNKSSVGTIGLYRQFLGTMTQVWTSTPTNGYPYVVKFADIDNDGTPDLLESLNGLRFYSVVDTTSSSPTIAAPVNISTMIPSKFFLAQPLDSSDTRPDLVFGGPGSTSPEPTILEQVSPTNWTDMGGLVPGPGPGTGDNRIRPMNLNGDGLVDLVDANLYDGMIFTYRNDDNFNFTQTWSYNLGNRVMNVNAGDFNNDGFDDIVANKLNGAMFVFLNNGDGTFAAPWLSSVVGTVYNTEILDLNGDGDLDLIAAPFSSGDVLYYENDGAGGFPLSPLTCAVPASQNYVMVAGDFDGNGVTDLAYGKDPITILYNALYAF